MPLKYGLVKNTLKTQSGKYLAVVSDNDSYNIEQVIEMMIQKGSTVTKAEALAVIEEYHQAIETLVSNGCRVNTELFSVGSSISGSFNSLNEPFDTEKHRINIKVKAGKRLTACSEKIQVKKRHISKRQPVIRFMTDLVSQNNSNRFSAGQFIAINGQLLKFNEQDAQQGVFIIDEKGHECKATNVVKNKPSELLLFIPEAIPTGDYKLELRTIVYRSTTIRKTSYSIRIV